MALEMVAVAIGWQVYEITRRPLDLGLVGLTLFLPGFFLFLVTGHAVDRFNRRNLLVLCQCGFVLCSTLLLLISLRGLKSVHAIYMVTGLLGVVRAFNGPTGQALLPTLVALEHYPNAVAWSATVFQLATIMGPMMGGLIYSFSHGPAAVYAMSIVMAATAAVCSLQIRPAPPRPREPVSLETILAGLRYVWAKKVILGSISLDLFAMFFGGAVALLPVFSREILHTGPLGLGILRSGPGLGAATMALIVAHRPLRGKAGATMLWWVAAFGAFTVVFGLSRNIVLSLAALFMVGAADMVSVIIRNTLVQLTTPDAMRGRVSAVNMLFIGASNELGQFESGITAQWWGVVPAVVVGGAGAIVVVCLWAWLLPELRRADHPNVET
ncbi:MAG: MFS transporter [Acidobacteriia bacterium]|nr:MFS transporter [Terriglobia bacterium]